MDTTVAEAFGDFSTVNYYFTLGIEAHSDLASRSNSGSIHGANNAGLALRVERCLYTKKFSFVLHQPF